MTRRKWGWIRDSPDPRDNLFAVPESHDAVPSRVDLSPFCPPVMDQGMLGSCTAQALAGALAALMKKSRGHSVPFSRLFIYYNERAIEGTIAEDSGAQIRDGLRTLAKDGACFEINWPYKTEKFAVEPEFGCYVQAEQFQITSYHRLRPRLPWSLIHCLADGFTFVGGVSVFESFESPEARETGVIPMPGPNEGFLGGHALHFCGYDLETRTLRGPNSWGTKWGDDGYFTMPLDYVAAYGADFWTIRTGEHLSEA